VLALGACVGSSSLEEVDYVTAPRNGGDCPLTEDISLTTTVGFDAYFHLELTLEAPATIKKRVGSRDSEECAYRPPACGDPSLPDFADLRALLADPEFIAVCERDDQHFINTNEWQGATVSRSFALGPRDMVHAYLTIAGSPPLCSTLEPGADTSECLPDVVAEVFDLVESFNTLHTCGPPPEE